MKAFNVPGGLAVAVALLLGLTACGGGQVASSQDETSGRDAAAATTTRAAPPQTVPPQAAPPPQTVPPQAAPPPQTVPPQAEPPARWDEGDMPETLADVGSRLEDAGYAPMSQGDAGQPIVRVAMKAGAWAYVLRTPKGPVAENMATSVEQLNASSRGRMVARLVGTTVYVASTGDELLNADEPLSPAQVAELDEIVDVASG